MTCSRELTLSLAWSWMVPDCQLMTPESRPAGTRELRLLCQEHTSQGLDFLRGTLSLWASRPCTAHGMAPREA